MCLFCRDVCLPVGRAIRPYEAIRPYAMVCPSHKRKNRLMMSPSPALRINSVEACTCPIAPFDPSASLGTCYAQGDRFFVELGNCDGGYLPASRAAGEVEIAVGAISLN